VRTRAEQRWNAGGRRSTEQPCQRAMRYARVRQTDALDASSSQRLMVSLSLDRRKAQPGNVPLYKPSCLFQQVCASWWELVHLLRQISSTSDEMMVMIA